MTNKCLQYQKLWLICWHCRYFVNTTGIFFQYIFSTSASLFKNPFTASSDKNRGNHFHFSLTTCGHASVSGFDLLPLSTVASTGKRNYADLAREQVVRSRTFLPRFKRSKLRWYHGHLRGGGGTASYELNMQLTLSGKNMATTLNIQQYWELLANNVGHARLHKALEFSLSGYAFNHRICLLESFIIKLTSKNFHRANATARCVFCK